jgi:hypothetical protein
MYSLILWEGGERYCGKVEERRKGGEGKELLGEGNALCEEEGKEFTYKN